MTDKKYEELLKCVKDYIEACEYWSEKSTLVSMKKTDQFKALEACLPPPPPSREEIADYLDQKICIGGKDSCIEAQKDTLYLNYAIEELRKEQ